APFVGRLDELKLLERAYGVARAGRPTVAHVSGRSGIGKSATVRSFLRGVAHVDQTLVLRGRCYQLESVPYKGFDGIVDELAEALGRLPPIELPQWIGELAHMFPALQAVPAIAERAAEPPEVRDAMVRRRRAFTALKELLVTLAADQPVVLAIDDLQWADGDSAALLEWLLDGKSQAALLVVASFRHEEAAQNPALAGHFQRFAHLAALGQAFDVPVAALAPADGEQLARATLRGLTAAAPEERVRWLAREAAGVPFFVEELARFVAARGEAALDQEVSLEGAIAARVRSLRS